MGILVGKRVGGAENAPTGNTGLGGQQFRHRLPKSVLNYKLSDRISFIFRRLHTYMSPKFQEALIYASEQHDGQWRKTTKIPYFAHVMAVAAIALEYGATEEEAMGALLHDVVEDCGGPPRAAEIRAKFGEAVVAIVLGCTDTDEFPKPPWQARKDRYIAHLAEASPSTLLVSAADKLANARSIVSDYRVLGEELWGRFNGGRTGTLWYYRTLADTFLQRRGDRLAGELDRVVREMESLAGARSS